MELTRTANAHKETCPAASICSFKTICAVCADAATDPIQPQMHQVEKGDILVVNPDTDVVAYVFQSGFYGIYGEAEPGIEVPFAIYGKGVVAGVVELYAPRRVSNTYDVRVLIPGTVCSLPAGELRKKLKILPYEYAQRIICCALMNQFSSVFALMRIRGRTYIYDQILSLFSYFKDLSSNGQDEPLTFEITQEEIAGIINANRMAVSRVLKKLQEDGLIEYSYKSITLLHEDLPGVNFDFAGAYISPEEDASELVSYVQGYLSDLYSSEAGV